jgi:ABC-type multidrug transport system fused ATPase/permease subunit
VVSDTIGDLARESLTLVGYVAVLLCYDARLAVVCLTSAPLIVYPLVRLGQRVRRTARRTQEAQEQMAHVSAEALTGHRIVKAFGAEAREATKFEHSSERFYRTSMRVTSVLSMLPPLMEMIGGVAFATALWIGSQEISTGRLSTGDFVTFITALFLMYGPARKLSRVNADLQQAAARSGSDFRDSRNAQRGTGAARCGRAPTVFTRHRVPRRALRLWSRPRPHASWRDAHRRGRADAGHRGSQRSRQDDAGQSVATVLRCDRRGHSD